ncbi:GroES-like protein [Zopfia rhizophila CBS 207.26]|uniref:GroES-like protein n=1 Tax=Zopfia rhizophila CBS 207.26 TaxID=1314779 RepID=A0A6A6E6F1_9PEZI|nr:GroES-like protein [Zopfia rhizophila CBS 207.26]
MSSPVRKIVFEQYGGPEVVKLVTAELPAPGKHEVQVKILYAGLGGSDIQMRNGTYPMQKAAPLTPGYVFVGRVYSTGKGVKNFNKGDLVCSLSKYDAQAERANFPETYLIPLPQGFHDLQQAVPLILDWTTAYGMVYRTAQIKKGMRVFIHGLSGAVGAALFKLCQLEGAEIYGTASQSNHAELIAQGAHPFVYTDKNWMKAMQDIGGAHVVFDALGFESYDESWEILAKGKDGGGHLIGYGGNLKLLNGEKAESQNWSNAKLLAKGLVPFCPWKSSFFYIDRDQKTFQPELQKLFQLSMEGKIHVPIKKVWELEEVPEAHRTWAQSKGNGSHVVHISDEVPF